MANFEEFKVQRAVFEKLNKFIELGMISPGKIIWTTSPNRFHSAKETALYKMHGYQKGQPDTVFYTGKGNFAIEFKSKKGSLSKEQIAWKEGFEAMGNEFYIIEDVESFVKVLYRYGIINEVKIL